MPLPFMNTPFDQAPSEDFYYLFLGRAYLENASAHADNPSEQERLLATAETRLKRAQRA